MLSFADVANLVISAMPQSEQDVRGGGGRADDSFWTNECCQRLVAEGNGQIDRAADHAKP